MAALVGVEPQRARERVEHLLGRPPVAPLLQPHVVVGGDRGGHRHLLAAQAAHAAAADPLQTELLGHERLTPGTQVLPERV